MVFLLLIVITLFYISYGKDIYIEAYSLEIDREKVIVRGDARISYGDVIIQSNRIIFDKNTKTIELKDYFILVSPFLQMKGAQGVWNLEEQEGELFLVEGIVNNRYYIKAEKLEKIEDTFYIYSGEFSMCPFNQYDWYVKSSKLRLKQNDYMYTYNVRLNFFKVPVLYLPFFAYPTYERKSGFLIPSIGQDTYNTFMFKIPFFYVINKSSDVTLTYDYRDNQGQGLNIEYRKRFSKDTLWTLDLFYFKEDGKGNWWKGREVSPRENRWRIQTNTFLKYSSWNIYLNIDVPSDHFFFEDFYSSSSLRYLSYTKSQILALYNGDLFTTEINFDYLYDLTKTTNRETLQRLPEVRFYLKQRQLFKYFPLYIDFLSVNTHFFREVGDKAFRSDNNVRLNLYFHFLGFNSELSVIPRSTLYITADGTDINIGSRNSVLVQENLRRSFLKSFKDFNYMVIPEISFSYLEKINEDEHALFDKEDSLFSRKDFDFAIHNILNFKKSDDFFRWSVYTGYSFTGKYQIAEKIFEANIKAIRNSFYFKIGEFYGENNLFFDFSVKRIVRSITSFNIPIFKWFEYSLTHSFDRGTEEEQGVNQIKNKVKITYKNLIFEGSILNNLKGGYVQQKRFSLTVDRKCWSLKFKYLEDFNRDTGRTYNNFVVAINFLNIEYALPFLKPTLFQR